jgi:hypothetical protein
MTGATCESCGSYGNRVDPVSGLTIYREYNGRMLCSSCRVDERLADGDFA